MVQTTSVKFDLLEFVDAYDAILRPNAAQIFIPFEKRLFFSDIATMLHLERPNIDYMTWETWLFGKIAGYRCFHLDSEQAFEALETAIQGQSGGCDFTFSSNKHPYREVIVKSTRSNPAHYIFNTRTQPWQMTDVILLAQILYNDDAMQVALPGWTKWNKIESILEYDDSKGVGVIKLEAIKEAESLYNTRLLTGGL